MIDKEIILISGARHKANSNGFNRSALLRSGIKE